MENGNESASRRKWSARTSMPAGRLRVLLYKTSAGARAQPKRIPFRSREEGPLTQNWEDPDRGGKRYEEAAVENCPPLKANENLCTHRCLRAVYRKLGYRALRKLKSKRKLVDACCNPVETQSHHHNHHYTDLSLCRNLLGRHNNAIYNCPSPKEQCSNRIGKVLK